MISEVLEKDGVTVVRITGRLDISNAPQVKAKAYELVNSGQARMVLDLKDMNFIDSSGLGVLVSCLRRCVAAGGDLCLAEVPEFALSILELTRLTRVFKIVGSEADGVAVLKVAGSAGT